MEKITKREMFDFLYNMADTMEYAVDDSEMVDYNITAQDVKDFCANEIDLLDKKASKAKERAAAKAKASDIMTDQVKAVLTGDYQTIPDIAVVVCEQNEDATVAKVQYRLGRLVKDGLAEKQEITIPATETAKTRHVMGYRLVNSEDAE